MINNPRNAIAVSHFTMQCAASRAHSALAAVALATYGNQGAQISGCVRDHFPDDIKQRLRELAKLASATAPRPKRMRQSTLNHIARLVATRDGSGFYGPQPYRSNGNAG